MNKAKHEIITFKADDSLLEAMKGIPNRSEFIRNAILAALDSACPLCSGTGVLSPHQKRHLDEFLADHSLQECEKCHDLRFVCDHGSDKSFTKSIPHCR
jgi:ribosomal protein S27AE